MSDASWRIALTKKTLKMIFRTSCVSTFATIFTFVVFQGVGGRVPRYHMDSLAEILMALNANCVTLLSTWLQV